MRRTIQYGSLMSSTITLSNRLKFGQHQTHIPLLLFGQRLEKLPAVNRRVMKRGIQIIALVVKDAKERELDHDPGLVGGGEDRAQPFDVFRMQPVLLRPGKERDQILRPRRQRIRIETEVARALEIAAANSRV